MIEEMALQRDKSTFVLVEVTKSREKGLQGLSIPSPTKTPIHNTSLPYRLIRIEKNRTYIRESIALLIRISRKEMSSPNTIHRVYGFAKGFL